RLTRTQDSIFTHGNVIECRINAENPEKGFRPSCGKIRRLHTPGGSFVRFDSAVYQDDVVPPYYDSMIGKLIVQARTRAEAIRKMKMALSELTIEGIDINRNILAEILSDEQFVTGEYTTDFMQGFEERRRNLNA
ncbi:MAG: acetyl-CoA carboxylase biotin carboxylase subunit, partial [Ruminococcus sp.]|nr:acetyl-CoA carboxylase biotin carboxylase subunit [Ruminococcus sp.]